MDLKPSEPSAPASNEPVHLPPKTQDSPNPADIYPTVSTPPDQSQFTEMAAGSADAPDGAVSVSPGLQKWLVITLAASVAIGLAWTIYTYMSSYLSLMQGFSLAYIWQALLISGSPVLFFVIAFFVSPAYPRRLNRWFMAALKATIGITVVGFAQIVESIISTQFFSSGLGGLSGMGGFVYVHYGMVASVLIVFTVLCLKSKRAS